MISSDTEAEITFLTTVFGAVETPGSRMLGPDGRVGHVEVELGDAVPMLFDAQPDWPRTPAHLRVYVASTQETFDRAVAAGGRAVSPSRPTSRSESGWHGCVIRRGTCGGIDQRLEVVPVDQLAERFADPAAQQAMAYVQQSLTSEMSAARESPVVRARPLARRSGTQAWAVGV